MASRISALAVAARHRIGSIAGPSRRPASPVSVVLWGKADCTLCDKAEAILARLGRDFPLDVKKRDITGDASAFARYRYVIPVVEFADGATIEGKITEHRLRQVLADRLRTDERR